MARNIARLDARLTNAQKAAAMAYGYKAFHEGTRRVVLVDVKFVQEVLGGEYPVDEQKQIWNAYCVAWYFGWDTANLNA